MEWIQLAVQAGGALGVCGMFLWYLNAQKQAEDDERKAFMAHLERKDEMHNVAIDKQIEYLKQRDEQSKSIAQTGHAALHTLATEITRLSEKIQAMDSG